MGRRHVVRPSLISLDFDLNTYRNAGGSTSDITLDLCSHIQNFSGLDVLMHITCTYMTRDKVVESLDRVSRDFDQSDISVRLDQIY